MDSANRTIKKAYSRPAVVEYGPVVTLTGACDGPCVDGVTGGHEDGG